MAFGLTATGFVRKDKDTITSELQARYRDLFGQDVDLSTQSPFGLSLQISAEELDSAWQYFEQITYANFLDTAEEVWLERLVAMRGLSRRQPTTEKVTLTFHGADYTEIPVGFLVQTPQGFIYKTLETVIINPDIISGQVDVQAECTLTGAQYRVNAGAVWEIVSPIAGLDSVTNASQSSGGSIKETDPELRIRYREDVAASSDINSLAFYKSKIEARTDLGIVSCSIYENQFSYIVGDMNAHSVHYIVEGGTDNDVADLILTCSPGAIEKMGSITKTLTRDNIPFIVKFSRPSDVDVWIKLDLLVNSDWDNSSLDIIKEKVIAKIGGIGLDNATVYKGLGTGVDVTSFSLYPTLEEISGIVNAEIKLGFVSSPIDQTFLDILTNQKAKTSSGKIVINTVSI